MAFHAVTPKDTLNRRLEEIGWGLFFLMIGGIWLLPQTFPDGAWLIGAGLILLLINGVRSLNGIAVSWFTIALGIVALAAGLFDVFGVKLSLFAVLFIVLGVGMIAAPLFRRTPG